MSTYTERGEFFVCDECGSVVFDDFTKHENFHAYIDRIARTAQDADSMFRPIGEPRWSGEYYGDY